MDTSRAVDLSPLAERAVGRMSYATDGRDTLMNDPDGWEVERPWLWWSGMGGDEGTLAGPWGNPIPGAGGPLWGLAALPAVTRCTSIIVDSIAGAPWMIRHDWDRVETPDWISDPQALRLDRRVADPGRVTDVRLSAVEFWANWILSALWIGDGFVYVPVRDDSGAPRPPIWQLHPELVEVEEGRYFVDDIELEEGTIIHLRGLPPYTDDLRGQGVLTRHGADLGLSVAVRHYAAGMFGAGVPAGYLKVNAVGLKPDQAQKIKNDWMKAHGGGRRSIAVLNATTDFQPISVSPIDAQLDRQREWGARDIAIAFGVPPYMLGVPGDSATYANVESRMVELKTFSLLPWARRIESVLDAQFPRGTELKIQLDALLRADTKSRYESYKLALDMGMLTVEEVRALEDRPPIEDATMTNIDPALPPVPVGGGDQP